MAEGGAWDLGSVVCGSVGGVRVGEKWTVGLGDVGKK